MKNIKEKAGLSQVYFKWIFTQAMELVQLLLYWKSSNLNLKVWRFFYCC